MSVSGEACACALTNLHAVETAVELVVVRNFVLDFKSVVCMRV
jgi:hypothetical protein